MITIMMITMVDIIIAMAGDTEDIETVRVAVTVVGLDQEIGTEEIGNKGTVI